MTAPIQPEHHETMNLIAKNLDDQLNPLRHMTNKRNTGFMLTVFDFDSDQGRFNYISNADKLDVRRMLQDVLARLDDRAGQNTEEMTVVPRSALIEQAAKIETLQALLKSEKGIADTFARVIRDVVKKLGCEFGLEPILAAIDTLNAHAADMTTSFSRAAADVLAERQRQIEVEGWTPEHDDRHFMSEMAQAAAAYTLHAANKGGWSPETYQFDQPPLGANDADIWPWSPDWWKPSNERRDLVKAAALIIAEIERLDRAAAKEAA